MEQVDGLVKKFHVSHLSHANEQVQAMKAFQLLQPARAMKNPESNFASVSVGSAHRAALLTRRQPCLYIGLVVHTIIVPTPPRSVPPPALPAALRAVRCRCVTSCWAWACWLLAHASGSAWTT